MENIFKQSRYEIALGICVSLLAAGLIWFQTEGSKVHHWLLISTTIYAVRYAVVELLSKKRPTSGNINSTRMLLAIGLFISGICWATLIVNSSFNTGTGHINTVVLLTAVFLSFAVFALYLGKQTMVLSFAIAALLGPLLYHSNDFVQHQNEIILVILWLLALFFACWRFSGKIHNTPIRQTDSINDAALKQFNEKLHKQLAASEAKVVELESALKMTTLDLETSQNKADALSITLNQINPFDLESGLLTEIKHKNILQREWARMGRLNLPITLMYLSLDDFDKYEEVQDKKTCTMTIKRVVKIIKGICQRPGDVFAKLKNQQLALLLPETELEDSIRLAEQISKEIEELQIPHVKNSNREILTASLGIATVIPNDLITEGEFLKRADAALYEAKFQGGNRVSHYISHPELKLEHWNEDKLGPVNAEKIKKRLAAIGFDTDSRTYLPGGHIKDRKTHAKMVMGILTGSFMVTVDGDAIKLIAGDILLIPKGMSLNCKVIGIEPVICLENNN